MEAYIKPIDIHEHKIKEDFGVAVVKGSSLTIPGQGSDLASIIASITKLPPIDERDYDSPAGVEPDLRYLSIKTDLDGVYLAEGKNLAEDAKVRQNARNEAKKGNDDTKEDDLPEDDDKKE